MNFINQIEPVYGKKEIKAVNNYLNSGGWLMEFKKTREFEEKLAEFTGAKYCSVVPSGTAALFIALKTLNIGSGDEVIVPDMTMAATPNAVIMTGARPVFSDIEKESLCLDVNKVEGLINKKTKAIIHVSLNGRTGQLNKLKSICSKNKIYLIEDAAQSLGSFYRTKHLGNFGSIGIFSFSVPKIITTGQGGALITNNNDFYQRIKKIKDFGRLKGGADFYDTVGWNFKFTDIQAVIGLAQFTDLRKRVEKKKRIFTLYQNLLSDLQEIEFIKTDLAQTSPWFIDILVRKRDELINFLKENGIGTRQIYPALHTQPAYVEYKKGRFPVSEEVANTGLWLPSAISLTDRQIKYICKKIREFYESYSSDSNFK